MDLRRDRDLVEMCLRNNNKKAYGELDFNPYTQNKKISQSKCKHIFDDGESAIASQPNGKVICVICKKECRR